MYQPGDQYHIQCNVSQGKAPTLYCTIFGHINKKGGKKFLSYIPTRHQFIPQSWHQLKQATQNLVSYLP